MVTLSGFFRALILLCAYTGSSYSPFRLHGMNFTGYLVKKYPGGQGQLFRLIWYLVSMAPLHLILAGVF